MAQTLTGKNLRTDEAIKAQKLIDFYEGDQLKYVVKDLQKYRKNWKKRTIIPRTRNITKSIVDKSGLLFNQPPTLEIVTGPGAVPVVDMQFNEMMEHSDWIEHFQNIDVYTRLCKSTVVLQQKYVAAPAITQHGQYVPDFEAGDALMLTLLTKANCEVVTDITGNHIIELAFLTSDIAGGKFTYRDITPEFITDWQVNDIGLTETRIEQVPNKDGFVPASFFYDVNRPLDCEWANIPEDIVALQEMLNLALTDTEFAMAHQKAKTLFTNARVENSSAKGSPTIPTAPISDEGFDGSTGRYVQEDVGNNSENMGGLGNVVTVVAPDAATTPYVKFDGPVSDLDKLTGVMEQLSVGVAYDWGVSLRHDGAGRANSGFQIIVEEMDNLQVRDQRGQSMQGALRRFYNITKKLYPTLKAGMLRAKFAPPSLPVDTMEQEQLWDLKIQGGRASVYDYLRQVDGLDDAAAKEKMLEIQQINLALGQAITVTEKAQASGGAPAAAAAPGASANPVGVP